MECSNPADKLLQHEPLLQAHVYDWPGTHLLLPVIAVSWFWHAVQQCAGRALMPCCSRAGDLHGQRPAAAVLHELPGGGGSVCCGTHVSCTWD